MVSTRGAQPATPSISLPVDEKQMAQSAYQGKVNRPALLIVGSTKATPLIYRRVASNGLSHIEKITDALPWGSL